MFEGSNNSSPKIISKVASNQINLLSSVNPKLPLIHEKSLPKKISRLFLRVLSVENKSKNSKKKKEYLDCNFEH